MRHLRFAFLAFAFAPLVIGGCGGTVTIAGNVLPEGGASQPDSSTPDAGASSAEDATRGGEADAAEAGTGSEAGEAGAGSEAGEAGAGSDAAPQTVFFDNFDEYLVMSNATDFGGNWTVSNGSVDVIGPGFFDLYPGHGNYIDLDGTTYMAGLFVSRALDLVPGNYELRFSLGGSQRGDVNIVDVTFGSFYGETFTRASADPLAPVSRTINVAAPTQARFSFHNQGGDNIGAVLDDVSVVSIP